MLKAIILLGVNKVRLSISGLWRKSVQSLRNLGSQEELGKLGDFTTTPRIAIISLMAIVIGVISAFVALILLRLIGLFTNLFFYQRWSFAFVSPAGNQLGVLVIIVPVIGALIIGFMARYGSERIRGHGIPEAIEAILMNSSRIDPKVSILKPLSSAISIGSGGPFGAEGPIIMTGGAFGSLIAQFFHLSGSERKTLLVAGAAGGMAATFAAPVAAVLLAVELLLFEWKPRSLIPVALASAAAAIMRRYLLGMGPLFPTPPHPAFIGPAGVLGCIVVGILAGALSALLTMAVYASEDAFTRLPIHWMWWPAIGGVVVGIGGFIFPRALGVGYDTIGLLLQGNATIQIILGVLLIKSTMWAVSLGSGTSGGVLAPLLMMGGALGGLLALFLPNLGPGFWELVAMSAILGGTMRSPFTGVIFTLELTHDVNMLLPLLIAGVIAHGFTVIVMRRSILTEKISRRGYHLSREYAVDPLEIIFVREAMRTEIVAIPDNFSYQELEQILHNPDDLVDRRQRLFPIVDDEQHLKGVATLKDLQQYLEGGDASSPAVLGVAQSGNGTYHSDTGSKLSDDTQKMPLQYIRTQPVVAYPDEPLRAVINRMAETGYTRLPVVERNELRPLVGMISLHDLLVARGHSLEEEHRRERVLRLRLQFPLRRKEETRQL
jgi:chloride channel protein, CIC family